MYMELVKGLLHSIGIKVSLSLGEAILSSVSISNSVTVKLEGMENNSKGIKKATSEG